MSWPPPVKDEVLVKCGRHCCICHKFCGIKMELHHIVHKSEGGEETVDNCIPLCFDCHADQRSYDHLHPKGTKYSREELVGHRDKWYEMASNNLGTGSADYLEQDRDILRRIFEMIPVNPTITFLRDHDFNNRKFNLDKIDSLYELTETIRQMPWFEFFDSDLESLKQSLLRNIEAFNETINKETFPMTGAVHLQEIPREWMKEQPDRYKRVVERLNELGDSIVEDFDSLIRLGRMKLKIVL